MDCSFYYDLVSLFVPSNWFALKCIFVWVTITTLVFFGLLHTCYIRVLFFGFFLFCLSLTSIPALILPWLVVQEISSPAPTNPKNQILPQHLGLPSERLLEILKTQWCYQQIARPHTRGKAGSDSYSLPSKLSCFVPG